MKVYTATTTKTWNKLYITSCRYGYTGYFIENKPMDDMFCRKTLNSTCMRQWFVNGDYTTEKAGLWLFFHSFDWREDTRESGIP